MTRLHARSSSRLFLSAAVCLLVTLSAGCSTLTFVKRRLPPPATSSEGVLFQFESPSAKVVQLMGDWPENSWGAGQAQTGVGLVGLMKKGEDGVWKRYEKLPPGRYQYKFKVDEINWKEDPNNPQKLDDGYGGHNSLLVIN